MAVDIAHNIVGNDLQIVEIELDPGEAARGEVGTMIYMDEGIEMQTSSGGLFKGVKRIFSGGSFFISSFINDSKEPQTVAFGASFPGQVIPIDLSKEDGSFLCQKDAFLCADAGIDITVAFTKKIGSGLSGGEGFILQRLKGDGHAFIHAGGTCIKKDLKKGETLRTDTGCLVGLSESVDYGIKFAGGFRNALFGGEGLFLAELQGPGTVFLQSLPFSRLVDRVVAAADFTNNDTENE